MKHHTLALSLILASCGAMQTTDDNAIDQAESQHIAIDEVVLSTDVDVTSFAPRGATGPVFAASTRRLFVSFQVRSGASGSPLHVGFYQVGASEPFYSTQLIVTGHRRMAAGLEPISDFEPGEYFVRIETEEETLTEVGFEVEGAAVEPREVSSGEATISRIRLVRALDDRGRPQGYPTTVLPAGSREVHCSFTVTGAPAGTVLSLRWIRGSLLVEVDDLGRVEGEEEILASLRSREPLDAGLYRAEVIVNGEIARSASFTVEQAVSAEELGIQVGNLTLTSAVDAETGRPRAPAITSVDGDEEGQIYLSLTFSRMPPESELEVRWFRDAAAGQPIAMNTFEVQGRGSFAATLTLEPPMERGRYHVDVVFRGRIVGSQPFTVEGDPLPTETDEAEEAAGE